MGNAKPPITAHRAQRFRSPSEYCTKDDTKDINSSKIPISLICGGTGVEIAATHASHPLANTHAAGFPGCRQYHAYTIWTAIHYRDKYITYQCLPTYHHYSALLCWLFLGEKIHGAQWLGLLSAFAGILLILLRGEWSGLGAMSFNKGDLMVLLATFGLSAYGINIRKMPLEFSLTESLFAVIGSGVIMLLPLYVAESMWHKTMPVNGEVVTLVSSLALFVSVLVMILWTRGTQLIGAKRAAIYLNLLPASPLFSWTKRLKSFT